MEELKSCLVLMVGLPGAGKSTISAGVADKLPGVKIIVFDDLEKQVEGNFDPKKWAEARELAYITTVQAIADGF